MHIKPLSISKNKIKKISHTMIIILISMLFGYFFGYLHHLYMSREPIEFLTEINPKGCQTTILNYSQ